MPISVKESNFALVFFKAACHANPGAKRNFLGSSSYISTHISTVFKHFEHTDHDIILNFFFQNVYKLFLRASNLH